MAGKVRKFIDFAQASGGITCSNDLYVLSEGEISIRAGYDDAAHTNARPRIDLVGGDVEKTITLFVEDNQQGNTSHIRPKADAGSGLMPLSVGSGFFYGVMTTASSGVPVNTGTLGVVPWESSINPADVHFAHDPGDAAINTHVTVLLTGWYTITYTMTYAKTGATAYSSVYTFCRLNDSVILPGSQTLAAAMLVNNGNTATWKGTIYLNVGDTLSVVCREFATAGNNVVALGNYCSFHIKYEGPAL